MKISTQLTLILLFAALISIVAAVANVTFDCDASGDVLGYNHATHWDIDGIGGLGIPISADDATAIGRFNINDGGSNALYGLRVNGGGSFVSDGSFAVTNDVVINSIVPAPSTYALVAGYFALAIVEIACRR